MATDITGIISNVGFPITAFLLMFYLVKDTISKNTEALALNTLAVNQLKDFLVNEKKN